MERRNAEKQLEFLEAESGDNLLPRDGLVVDHGVIFPEERADHYLEHLLGSIPWQHDEVVLFGKRIVTARKVSWHGDPGLSYTYSGTTRVPAAWSPLLREIKETVEAHAGTAFNSCLLNFYADGEQGMGWHSDDESSLVARAPIASLSFGAARKFRFRHRLTQETVATVLKHGSLLVMAGATQERWQHTIPKSKRVSEPRVNLTFRQMQTVDAG